MYRFVFALVLWATTTVAQTYPTFQSTTVNDFADLLNNEQETALSSQLNTLRTTTGVEMTVVTLRRQADYAPNQSLETFATGLFNHWGVGAKARNDGVMVLIFSKDRTLRIELGAAYGRNWDGVAAGVIKNDFVPALSKDDFATGISTGSTAVIDKIVRPFLNAETPVPSAEKEGDSNLAFWIMGLFLALTGLQKGRHVIGDGLARLRRCPKCGARSLHQHRDVLRPASTSARGRGRRRITCARCDYIDESSYVIAQIPRHRSGGFGGGRSGGGGASGRF